MALAKSRTIVWQSNHQTSPDFFVALKTGLIFGLMEGITPILGYVLGVWAEDWVKFWDHWLSFVLLAFLGGQMIYHAHKNNTQPSNALDDNRPPTLFALLITAFATSVDAMIVGVTLAFLQVNIIMACALIALATTLMATLGLYFGHRLGAKIGQRAETMGGMILIGIGTTILFTHLLDHVI